MSLIRKGLVVVSAFLAAASVAQADKRTEDRTVSAFSTIRVEGGIDVSLSQSGRARVTVEAEDDSLEDVITVVEDGELRISRARSSGFRVFGGGAVVHVEFAQLSGIEASGGSDIDGRGEIRLDDLSIGASGGSDIDLDVQAKRIEFRVSGGSDIDLQGSTDSLEITASGGSDVSAGKLAASRVKLLLSGGSDAIVNAKEAIEVDASGGSDVRILGNPAQRTVNNDRSSGVSWR